MVTVSSTAAATCESQACQKQVLSKSLPWLQQVSTCDKGSIWAAVATQSVKYHKTCCQWCSRGGGLEESLHWRVCGHGDRGLHHWRGNQGELWDCVPALARLDWLELCHRDLVKVINIPYSQSSAKLPIPNSGHLGHLGHSGLQFLLTLLDLTWPYWPLHSLTYTAVLALAREVRARIK